jgi:hypothetical protein
MNEQNDHSDDSAIEAESVQVSLTALLTAGLIRWNGRFRAGRPIFVPTESARQLNVTAATGADPATDPTTSVGDDDWDGEIDALELITPDVAADHHLCERTFASEQEAFTTGLLLGARGLPAYRRLPARGTRALPTREQ